MALGGFLFMNMKGKKKNEKAHTNYTQECHIWKTNLKQGICGTIDVHSFVTLLFVECKRNIHKTDTLFHTIV